jgi:hypothetical protein
MGGFGSGRPDGGGRGTVEQCRSIDVNRLHRDGCLSPGWQGICQWFRDSERTASISMRMESQRLVLNYRVHIGCDDWKEITESVPIVHVPCRFGGSRSYFLCPGVVNNMTCGQRVAKLYGADRYFLCRHCYRLAYASQNEDASDRALRRANKIRRRLGGDPGMAAHFPDKPKGMWRRTYKRLRNSVWAAEMMADEAIAIRTAQLLSKIEQPKRGRGFWQ